MYWADRVIAVSQATRNEIAWMYQVPDAKSVVVHNGVTPHRFDVPVDATQAKSEYGIAPQDPTVLFCGRLEWQKGPDILMEAIAPVLRNHPNAKFLFAGDGEMRAGLEARARHLNVGQACRFLGFRKGNELPRLFGLSDVVCVPSRNEPFGIVVLEAWSSHKPVVVTQNGGPAEYVDHERTGLKIWPTTDSVAWGIETMLNDFDRARWMGQNGRRMVEARFTWDRIAECTLDVYDPDGSMRTSTQPASSEARPARRSGRKRNALSPAANVEALSDCLAAARRA